MQTIEERAARNSALLSVKFGINEKMVKALYVAIATEQKAIDDADRDTAVYNILQLKFDSEKKLWLDKACEWIYEHFLDYCSDPIGCRFDDCEGDFRKAMEE